MNHEIRALPLVEARSQRMAARVADMLQHDPQVQHAVPSPLVKDSRSHPGLGLAQVVSIVMDAYSDRPALGQRAHELVVNAATGRREVRLLPAFETVTYAQLWKSAQSLAAAWQQDPALRVTHGEFVCILAFAGVEYVIADLAAIHVGAVVVPLQTTATLQQLVDIVAETTPRCIATSLDQLNTVVDILLAGACPASVLVFDYAPGDDTQRDTFEAARQRLADAGHAIPVYTLQALCEQGAALPPPPVHITAPGTDPMATLYYTSGSTGSPKGAMYTERLVKGPWLAAHPTPLINVHYMPMNHSFGRSIVAMTLTNGGTCYFTGKSDLSTLFEDIRLVRPTQIGLVPRICEMIQQQYVAELERSSAAGHDQAVAEQAAVAAVRDGFLGGRIMAAVFGSAPMTAELRALIEACLDLPIMDGYGTTETAGIALNGRIMRPPVIDYKLVDVPELGYFRTDQPHPRGELLVRTANIMAGYYKRPELSASMFDAEGYYRTGDIMAETGPDQIAYLDRRNNVLKLAQGEFVSIASLEAAYASGHPLIEQIYLYGTSDRDFLLAVVVPRRAVAEQQDMRGDPARLKSVLRAAIKEIARTEQFKAYEVPRDFVVEPEPFSIENGMLSSIGKHLRPALKARYAPRLEQMYTDIAGTKAAELRELRRTGRDAPVLQTVMHALEATLGIEHLDPVRGNNFSDVGGDSLSALSFSLLLEEIYGIDIPVGVITNPANDLYRLAAHIEKALTEENQRPTAASVHGSGASAILASDLTLDKFIDQQTLETARTLPPCSHQPARTVLLTGANGFLGRFLCLGWLEALAKTGGKLICIARGTDDTAARSRIAEVFNSGDAELKAYFDSLSSDHLEVLAGDIAEPRLGLDEATWLRLADTVDLIVHPAALVNHVLPYAQLFGPNVVGTAELIRLALTSRLKAFNNVSTVAAAILADGAHIDEDADLRLAAPSRPNSNAGYASGYASSKWAGEVLLREAHEQFGVPVAVFRSDMILAHSRYAGQLNLPDMFTRLLYSVVVTGIVPPSFYDGPQATRSAAHYDGLPVDFTAAAIVEIGSRATHGFQTYHVLNPHDDGISLDTFVNWIAAAGYPVHRLDDYGDWALRFETALRALPEAQRARSSLPLIHQLKRPMPAVAGSATPAARFHAAVRAFGVGPHTDIPHLSEAFIRKYLSDLQQAKLL